MSKEAASAARTIILIVLTLMGSTLLAVYQLNHVGFDRALVDQKDPSHQIIQSVRGIFYLAEYQIPMHQRIITGQAEPPYQYRLFDELNVELFARAFKGILGLPDIYLFYRIAQVFIILILAFHFYRRIGVPGLLGVSVLIYSISLSLIGRDLCLSNYTELIIWLGCLIAFLKEDPKPIIFLTILGALVRETIILIPLLLILKGILDRQKESLKTGLISLFGFLILFSLVRFVLFPRGLTSIPIGDGTPLSAFAFNILNPSTYTHGLVALSLFPIAFLLSVITPIKRTPSDLWLIYFFIASWYGLTLFLAIGAEVGLFLVPQAILFIPGVILIAQPTRTIEKLVPLPPSMPGSGPTSPLTFRKISRSVKAQAAPPCPEKLEPAAQDPGPEPQDPKPSTKPFPPERFDV